MIGIKNLTFSYNQHIILQNLTCSIPEGDFCAIVGPNGVGKSTLLKLIAQLLPCPDQAGITLNGQPLREYSPAARARTLAYVPQQCQPAFDLPVEDAVAMGRNPYLNQWGTLTSTDKAIVDETLVQTGLDGLRKRPLSQLSGGELQRTMVARAMAQQTPLMLLDEPLANLDAAHQYEIMDQLFLLNRERKNTILLVIHDFALAKQYASSALLLAPDHAFAYGATANILTPASLRSTFGLPSHILIDEQGHTTREKINLL